jgi:hypothetical protein
MVKRILLVSIESINVFQNGDVLGQGAPAGKDKRNALMASLKYPRSGAPSVTSGQHFDLTNNVPLKPDQTDFFQCGIFKEEVQDETILQVKLTDTDESGSYRSGRGPKAVF